MTFRQTIEGIGIIKDEFGEKIMIKFVGLRAKPYSYLIDDSSEDKTANGTQKVCHKKNIKFEIFENCLQATQIEDKINNIAKYKIDIGSLKTDQKDFIKTIN